LEYRFGEARSYEDFAAGRVFYGRPGAPNFPVRLTQELFGRCLSHSVKKNGLVLYDPCCGSGYLLR
jgi:hypothetical protein